MEQPRTRERIFSIESGQHHLRTYSWDGTIAQSWSYNFVNRQQTIDSVTQWPIRERVLRTNKTLTKAQRLAIRRQDYGCNFTSTTSSVTNFSPYYWITSGPYRYNGPFYAHIMSSDYSKSGNQSHYGTSVSQVDEDLFAAGGTAISRCAPVKPQASLFVTLGELKRDGLPSIPGAKLRKSLKPSTVGDEYLNVVFGLQPLISDLQKLAESAVRADKLVKQYIRDSGRLVRRGYEFPLEETSEEVLVGTNVPPQPTFTRFYSSNGTKYKTTTRKTRTWFSGAFTYYVDEKSMGGLKAELLKMNHLYGVLPTPGAVYNLTPWSWAIDWFINLGDVINNLSYMMADGLVMPYGYVMRDIQSDVRWDIRGAKTNAGEAIVCDQVFSLTGKFRRKASPFGFGFVDEDFSPRQWAIVAALGLSQGGRRIAW